MALHYLDGQTRTEELLDAAERADPQELKRRFEATPVPLTLSRRLRQLRKGEVEWVYAIPNERS